MMRSILCAALGIPAFAAQVHSQATTLRGTVYDRRTNEGVAEALVFARQQPNARVRSDAAGRFVLRATLPAELIVARLGFAAETLVVSDSTRELRVALEPSALRLTPTLVSVEQPQSAAASRTVREVDITIRPRASSQELLRLAPGLVIAQHAGGGKAEQIFLRGFDADHGTDVAISVDGMPVNLASHGHGQGYADLHFVIPEIVSRVDVRKGPYDTRDGDLAVAGSINLVTRERVDAATLSVRGGSFYTFDITTLLPLGGDASRPGGYLAGTLASSDGPFDASQDFRRWNAYGKYSAPLGNYRVGITLSGFSARWDASGQIPDRAVRSGLISRFGAIDSTEGGRTSRYDVMLSTGGHGWGARAFATKYDFRLFSNFTLFLEDPVNGDGIEQVDDRTIAGASVWAERLATFLGAPGTWRATAGTRWDATTVGLYASRDRLRSVTRNDNRVRVDNLYMGLDRSFILGPRVRATLGVRADAFHFDLHDRTGSSSYDPLWLTRVSPKATLTVEATPELMFFANAGAGFHSNDARAVVRARTAKESLPRAVGYEIGVRRTWHGATLAASLWSLDLSSELVWSGDGGTIEPSGRSRRVGVDVEGRVRLLPWLWGDADVNLARGRMRDEPSGANKIPLAPSVTSTGGLTTTEERLVSGGLRWRHVAARPANEDNSVRARGYTLAETFATLSLGRSRIRLAVDNLFDVSWNEAQFATTSRLRGEANAVTELHYTPGAPRTFTLGIERQF